MLACCMMGQGIYCSTYRNSTSPQDQENPHTEKGNERTHIFSALPPEYSTRLHACMYVCMYAEYLPHKAHQHRQKRHSQKTPFDVVIPPIPSNTVPLPLLSALHSPHSLFPHILAAATSRAHIRHTAAMQTSNIHSIPNPYHIGTPFLASRHATPCCSNPNPMLTSTT